MNPNPRVVESGADVPSHFNNSTRDTSDNNMVGRMRCLGGVTMIAPNESRRKETLMIAQKEEEELQKWKEANRHTHVHTTPERLGGNATLAEVRERQFKDLRCSKMEKKLKQEDMAQKKRQEEEDEFKRKKHEQRKKAECLVEEKQVKEKKRQEQLRQDCAQVNSAFLDKLDRHEKGSEKTPMRKVDVSHSPLSTDGQEKLGPHPEESCSSQMMQNDRDQDEYLERCQYKNLEWALMKLMVNFPELSRVFLEDILDQCAGDYQRAHTLVKHAMT